MLATENGVAVHRRLLERVADARRRSDELFSLVRTESLYERPIPERHRIIFYVGHLEAFDWNLLAQNFFGIENKIESESDSEKSHPALDRLFAFGIDPVGSGLPSDQPSDWPSLSEVRGYVTRVRAALDNKLASASAKEQHSISHGAIGLDTLLNVAVEHRLMHVETLAYMLHQLPLNQKVRQAGAQNLETAPLVHQMVEIPAGVATLGLRRDHEDENFGWDNEYEAHSIDVPAFAIDQYKVTNRQYLEFMAAGGYETRSFWSNDINNNNDDWNWRTAQRISHPVFWKKTGDRWFYRAMFDEMPLLLDWPVYVSHAEASAYARWAGKSLPTEAEWHRAAYGNTSDSERTYPWGNEPPDDNLGNFDLRRWDPVPVNAFPEGRSAFGVHGMLGNGWEWTSTPFAAFQGFTPFSFYRGYSADFFDGKHFVMKGASARTAACMLRPTFRNWFQAHYQYVYTGFRCVSH
ncbi:MAG: SUMF1/EgtB/PvdO family nonheme iron enzyme [Terriglobales bacterium]|jgi:iron(II)-dependent oxidoreductase